MEEVKELKKPNILILSIVFLLSIIGGMFDGYSYLVRGNSFSTMQTGNMIYLTLNILEGKNDTILLYLIPIIFFSISIILVTILKHFFSNKNKLFLIICLFMETIFVISSAFIPKGELNYLSTSLLSCASGIQFSMFLNLDKISLTTTMCTANLKNASENVGLFISKKETKYLWNALKYFFVILFFLLGIVIGYYLSPIFNEYSILFTLILFGAVITLFIFVEKF